MRPIRSSILLAAFAALGLLALACGEEQSASTPPAQRSATQVAPRTAPAEPAALPPVQPAEATPHQPPPAEGTAEAAAAPSAEPPADHADEKPVAPGGFFIDSLILARGIEQRQPVDPGTSFAAPEPIRLYAVINLVNPERVEGELQVTWLAPDGKERGKVALSFPGQPRWRTWSYYSHIGKPGRWEAIIRTADGQELGRAPFDITP